jgi:hypothetical protein
MEETADHLAISEETGDGLVCGVEDAGRLVDADACGGRSSRRPGKPQ